MKLTVTQNINKLNLKVTQNNTIVKLQPVLNSSNFTETDPIFQASEASLFVTGDKDKLDGIEAGAEVNVQSDWNQINPLDDSYIKNKPTIPTVLTNHSELTLDDGTNPHGTTKSDVGLSNVDNTSDIDKPISTATQQALDLKANASDLGDVAFSNDYNDLDNKPTIPNNLEELHNITETNYTTPIDTDSLLTFDVNDSLWKRLSWANIKSNLKTYFDTIYQTALGFIPENVANKANDLTSPDNTKYPTTLAVSTALSGKQDTLTNPITGTGANGQVAFFNGVNSQAGDDDLFWNTTLGRLELTTSNLTSSHLLIKNSSTSNILTFRAANADSLIEFNNRLFIGTSTAFSINQSGNIGMGVTNPILAKLHVNGNTIIGASTTTAGARLDVRAQGALATDIAFRVRNSADSANLVSVNGIGELVCSSVGYFTQGLRTGTVPSRPGYFLNVQNIACNQELNVVGSALIGLNGVINNSAQLQVDSTTRGFLPPRMTTTQRNAIATPAAGLIVYDTTENKHYGYNGTTWNAFY